MMFADFLCLLKALMTLKVVMSITLWAFLMHKIRCAQTLKELIMWILCLSEVLSAKLQFYIYAERIFKKILLFTKLSIKVPFFLLFFLFLVLIVFMILCLCVWVWLIPQEIVWHSIWQGRVVEALTQHKRKSTSWMERWGDDEGWNTLLTLM